MHCTDGDHGGDRDRDIESDSEGNGYTGTPTDSDTDRNGVDMHQNVHQLDVPLLTADCQRSVVAGHLSVYLKAGLG